MALIWMDGFDHYGTGTAGRLAMLDGVWAEITSGGGPVATNPRTGINSFVGGQINRRILGSAKSVVGIGMAFYVDSLPTTNNRKRICDYRDFSNNENISIILQTTGAIQVYRGDNLGTLIGTTANGVIVAAAYQHIECRVSFDTLIGSVEIRVNGVTVLNLSGVNTIDSGAAIECSQISIGGNYGTGAGGTNYIDDVFVWDDSGSTNNDFLGDRRVRTIFPDADTVTADWVPTGAVNGYDCINDPAPDDETTYINAAPLTGDPLVPLDSVFELQDVPEDIGAIAAVQTYTRMRKTEAGDNNVQVSMVSNGAESNGADRPITEIYTYWMDVHELDPNTGTPWTEASLNAAQLKVRRTM